MTVTNLSNPVILQVLPHMGAGGVPRGVIDIASAVVDSGWTALVASEGGVWGPRVKKGRREAYSNVSG